MKFNCYLSKVFEVEQTIDKDFIREKKWQTVFKYILKV